MQDQRCHGILSQKFVRNRTALLLLPIAETKVAVQLRFSESADQNTRSPMICERRP